MNRYTKMMLMRDREEKPVHDRVVNNYFHEPVDMSRDYRGRDHYSNGRYAPMSYEYPEMGYIAPYMSYNEPTRYGNDDYKRVMGFGVESRYDFPKGDEIGHKNGRMERGHGSANGYGKMTAQQAHEWVTQMKNGDGSTGEHWSMEQASQLMEQKGYKCDPVEFYTALNMMYSDYYKVAKKLGVNNADFYGAMAEAFLTDEDAGPGKMAKYCDVVR